MKPPGLIVFDMDGVLIDVSNSYREAARRTARIFFNGATGFEYLPDPLFPLTDLAALKQTGGLNNDWDITALTLRLMFANVKTRPANLNPAQTVPDDMIRLCDVTELAAFMKSSSSPLTDLLERYGRREEPLVDNYYRGDVCTGNRIKRIFQEIYLGPVLFAAQYRCEPAFYHGEGLIYRERLLIEREILASLFENHILAIATGRPRAEADFTIDRFDLRKFFQLVITLDECTREEERILAAENRRVSLNKPSPYMLDQIAGQIGRETSGRFYLGDMPDDMVAACSSKSGYRGIGVLISSSEPEKLRQSLLTAGATLIITDYGSLPEIVA